jgi:glycosyltransferase involved in cell wall biosynthesis
LSRLSQAIYDSRPDIQQIWPDPCGADGIGFLLWFLTHGTREYSLVEELVSPLRAQWGTVLQSLESPWQRFWYRCLLIGMKTSSECRASIGRMAEFIRMSAVMHTSALRKRRRPDLHIEQPTAAIRAEQVAPEGSGGVNLVGYLRSEMGVGESVRCAARAARSAGIPVALRTVDSEDGPFELGDHSAGLEDREFPHPVNVFHVNADQAPLIMAGLDRELLTGRRNIGYWAWELSEFPDRWLDSFRFFEEIWTPSSFCQDAIARKSSAPVLRIPHAIQADYRVALDRSSFSIPEDRFVFLSVFDLLSVFERKNPLGTIEAFARAFRSSKQCHLVLKVNHAGRRPREMERIAQACAGLPVTILDHTMSREHVNSLIRCCDALISLHRSEGFGLSIAEAMYLGKPVIVTAYSGNMDFTRPDNSFLVGYDLSQVPAGCEPYDEGMTWAEPRVKDAAALLRFVVESPELRQGRALRGKSCIQEEFSPAAIGRLMRNRLDRIIPRVEPAGFVRPPAALARQAPDLLTTARTAS